MRGIGTEKEVDKSKIKSQKISFHAATTGTYGVKSGSGVATKKTIHIFLNRWVQIRIKPSS
jgi:hypothetical protein